MKVLKDCFENSVRLTDERLEHIHLHPEMVSIKSEIAVTLKSPEVVKCSRSDDEVKLFYRFYADTLVGGKWLCVVTKADDTGAFVVTAYLTDKIKQGEDLWPMQ